MILKKWLLGNKVLYSVIYIYKLLIITKLYTKVNHVYTIPINTDYTLLYVHVHYAIKPRCKCNVESTSVYI